MILVTGGAGFIGSNLVRHILSTDPKEHVVVLDALTYAGNLANLKDVDETRFSFERGDIGDFELVTSLLKKYRPDAILHLAAESHVDRSIESAGAFVATNVNGTHKLLEAARDYRRSLSEQENEEKQQAFRFVHVSTDEVYGTLGPDDKPFCETTPYRPNSPYAASKAASDMLARAWHKTYGLPVIITNCSNNYGPYQFPEKLIPLVIMKALRGEPLPIYGDGKQVRDWLYVTDHCCGILDALAKGRIGETYIIGGGSELTNIDLVRKLCGLLDDMMPKSGSGSYADQITHVKDRAGHDRRYSVNCDKAGAELGYAAKETLHSGLKKTVKWYLDNSKWVDSIESGAYSEWLDRKYGEIRK